MPACGGERGKGNFGFGIWDFGLNGNPPSPRLRRARATDAKNTENGLHRRIAKIVPDDPEDPDDYTRTDYYYTFDWQVFEKRVNTRDTLSATRSTPSTTVTYQYVWDPRYIDAPVCRDEDKNSDGDCTDAATGVQGSNSGDEHLYYCQDGNYNTTSLVDSYDGAVVERYMYDPYGKVSVRHGVRDSGGTDTSESEWDERTSNTFDNEILYCGYRYDTETGLYHVRHRSYHPTLGRWMQRDRIGYADGMSLYEYVMGNPLRYLDSDGTRCGDCCPPADPKDNYYDIEASEPIFTTGYTTPSERDFSEVKFGLTVIVMAADVAAVGGGAASGMAKGGTALAGGLLGASSRVSKRAKSGSLPGMDSFKDAAFEGIEAAEKTALETGNWGGVRMWVKVRYKSCDPCWGFNPMRSYNPLNWFFWDYEMTEHETPPHECQVGSVKPDGQYDAQGPIPGRYNNRADAMQYKEACKAEAVAALK